jgi:N-acetylneuraminic acid mutarotase
MLVPKPIVWYTLFLMQAVKEKYLRKSFITKAIFILLCTVSIGISAFIFIGSRVKSGESRETLSITEWVNTNAPAPIPLFESQGVVIGKKMYVFGGFNTGDAHATAESFVYDSATNGWAKLKDMPEPLTHAGTATDGKYIYFAGGFIGSHPGPITNHVWKYDTTTDEWGEVSPLPAERAAGVLVMLGQNLHFFGGGIRNNQETSIVKDSENHWMLNLANPTGWKELAPLPNPRNHFSGVVLHGKIYAIGGQHLEGAAREYVSDVQMYDPKTNTWERKTPMPFGISHIGAATFVVDGKIVTIGGITEGQQLIASVLLYDPKEDVWEYLASVPQPIQASVAGVIGDTIYMTTGKNGKNILLSETIKGKYKITKF